MSKHKYNRSAETDKKPDPEQKEEGSIQGEMQSDEIGAEQSAKDAPEEVNPLQAQLDEANAKVAEYLAMAQRVQADFENYRRRNESIRADSYADGRKDVAAVMLPVLDNLERAVEAGASSQDEALKNGMELVLKQMQDVYQKLNVTVIDRAGERFDPNLENAILQGTAEEGEPGTVCQVLQKGYKMGDKVLRHAMVKVVPE
jgi:molecular chaperone GrpE